jgi:hypothetical protein
MTRGMLPLLWRYIDAIDNVISRRYGFLPQVSQCCVELRSTTWSPHLEGEELHAIATPIISAPDACNMVPTWLVFLRPCDETK